MAEEPSASSLPRTPTVFVTDAAEESSRVADTLRSAGYAVVDVPLSLLVSRVQVQRPQVVLVDVDASGALDQLAFVRKLPGSGAIDFVYFGTGAGSVRNADDALTQGGSAFFLRPIDIGAVVRRLEALTGGPVARPEVRPSTPPMGIMGAGSVIIISARAGASGTSMPSCAINCGICGPAATTTASQP